MNCIKFLLRGPQALVNLKDSIRLDKYKMSNKIISSTVINC
jgi:hypothetical protein